MYVATAIIVLVMLAMAGSAVAGLYWAAQDGQFSNLADAGSTIFDEDEPEGVMTDHFPSETPTESSDTN